MSKISFRIFYFDKIKTNYQRNKSEKVIFLIANYILRKIKTACVNRSLPNPNSSRVQSTFSIEN